MSKAWTKEEVAAADQLLQGFYLAGQVLPKEQVVHWLTQLALFHILSIGLYQSFPTLESFMAFMHDDRRVKDALRERT